MQLPSFLYVLRPIFSKFRYTLMALPVLVWIGCLVWVWNRGKIFTISDYRPLETLESRWLVTAGLIIIAISYIAWKMILRLKMLEKRHQEDKKNLHNPIQEEMNAQRRYLDHWVAKFKRYVDSHNYEYSLPWYIALGMEGSGKQTLLKEGGQFVELYSNSNETPVYFSMLTNEKAVVVNPSSSLIIQDIVDDKPSLHMKLWNNLLFWVKEQRERQPFNGVILSIDIHKLLVSNKYQKEEYLSILHQRLQEILDISANELPIYVVMTKLDRLYGFESVYRTLSREQRDSILGITFENHGENWKSELANFWSKWCEQMNGSIAEMLYREPPGNRGQVFSFIRQIAGAYEIVETFLENLITNGGKSFHFYKGMYLTSSIQNGKMDDVFVQSASQQYKLGVQTYPTWLLLNIQPYFCYDLLHNKLFSYPNLAKESKVWKANYNKKLKAFSWGAGFLAMGLIGGWNYFYNANYQAGINVLEQVKAFKNIEIPSGIDNYGDKQLPILNPMREATLSYGDYHTSAYPLKDMGLYQGNNIGPYVESTYLKLLQLRYLPAIMNGLMIKLEEAPNASEEKLEILRVMRMLDDKSGRDNLFVEDYMRKYWSEIFSGQKGLQANLLQHLNYALNHTDWYEGRLKDDDELIQAYKPYELSIQNAQRELSQLSIYDRVYQNLKIRANSVLPSSLNYRDEIGTGFDSVFVANNREYLFIPRFFTETGLKNYFVKQKDQLVEFTAIDSWVLNLKDNLEYSDADKEKITERIAEQYLNDYVLAWRSAINNLDIKDFNSIDEAILALEKITGGEQTFKRALQVLAEHTASPVLPSKEGKELSNFLESLDYRLMSQIDKSFTDEKSVLVESSNKDGILNNVHQKISNLHRYLLSIKNAPVPGKSALKAVQIRINQESTDPILELQQLAKTMPQPINRWLEQLADYSWRSVLKSAIASLEVEWKEKVVNEFRSNLAGRYPFNKNASKEVSLNDFSRFFGPGGIIDSFYENNLKAFIENDLGQSEDDIPTLIRDDVLVQLYQAEHIREIFFSKENGLGTQYVIEPADLSSNNRRSILNLDGQIVDFSHGGKRKTNIVWPNSMNASVESKLTLVSTQNEKSPRSLIFKGPWAQLRILNSGKVIASNNGMFTIRYDFNNGYATYRIHVDESANPFELNLFEKFKLPDTLY